MSDGNLLIATLVLGVALTLGLALHELRLNLRHHRAERARGADDTSMQAVLVRVTSVTLTGGAALLGVVGLAAGALRWLAENAV